MLKKLTKQAMLWGFGKNHDLAEVYKGDITIRKEYIIHLLINNLIK